MSQKKRTYKEISVFLSFCNVLGGRTNVAKEIEQAIYVVCLLWLRFFVLFRFPHLLLLPVSFPPGRLQLRWFLQSQPCFPSCTHCGVPEHGL